MPLFEIKHRYNGTVLFGLDCESLKICLEAAIRSYSNLRGSDLSDSNLSDSDLSGSDLSDSNLRGSDLSGSDLRGSDLRGSNLSGSDLSGSKWKKSAVVKSPPVSITGLCWPVLLFGSHLQIGCECHAVAEWEAFDERRFLVMGGREAVGWWAANKDRILAFRDREAEAAFAAQQAATA